MAACVDCGERETAWALCDGCREAREERLAEAFGIENE